MSRIQLRRDTAANWTSANPTLAAGEVGIEFTSDPAVAEKFKIGDGVTAWTSLPYVTGGGGGGAPDPHAASHADGGSDEISIDASQITTGTIADARIPAAITRDTELAAHEADTTVIHGIADTSTLYRASGTDVAVADGGTGASTAANARTNLGLVIGTDVAANTHNHAAGDVNSGTIATARLGSGTADNTTFLRGDSTWATPAGGGSTDTTWEILIIPVHQVPFAFDVGGAWGVSIDTYYSYLGSYWSNGNGNQNAYSRWKVLLGAGTWTCRIWYRSNASNGIAALSLDATQFSTVDMYSASAVYNVLSTITGIVIASTGIKTFEILMSTKNASSGDYRLELQAVQFQRTL